MLKNFRKKFAVGEKFPQLCIIKNDKSHTKQHQIVCKSLSQIYTKSYKL